MRRLLLLTAAIVLVDTMFYAAITPLLPRYVNELGLSKSAAGILTASYAAGTLLGSFPGGWLAARFGVKPAVITGLGLMSVSGLVFGFTEEVAVLDAARFMQGIGGAFSWAGALSWLVAATPRDRRGEMLGSVIAAAITGVLLGPALGGIAVVAGPEPVFAAVALLGAGLALSAWRVPAPPPLLRSTPRTVAQAMVSAPVLIAFSLVLLPAQFSGVLNVLVPLRLDDLGASGVFVGAAFLVAGGAEALASRLFGAVSDRRGRTLPIYAGLAASSVVALLMPLPEAQLILATALVAAAVGTALFWAPASALLSDSAEEQGLDLGFAFALVNLAWAGGQILGGAGGARLAEAAGDAVPYLICSALFALALAGLVTRSARRPQPAARTRS
jgi:MFS family permease